MNEFCTECGAELGHGDLQCATCHAPMIKNNEAHKVYIYRNQSVPRLSVCCCCLNPADAVKEIKLLIAMHGNSKEYLNFPTPWCANCWSRRRSLRMIMWVTGIGALILAVSVGSSISDAGYNGWASFFGGLVVGCVAFFVVARFSETRSTFRRRGHVSACDAVTGAQKFSRIEEGRGVGKGYVVVFRNKAFADRLSALLGVPPSAE